jgi:hypothetical protein
MKNLRIKQTNKYFLYTLLCVCCFAVVYGIGWFISFDPLWFVEMTTNIRGRGTLLMLSVLTIGLCYATSLLISDN